MNKIIMNTNKYLLVLLLFLPTLIATFIPFEVFTPKVVILLSVIQLLLFMFWIFLVGRILFDKMVHVYKVLNYKLFKLFLGIILVTVIVILINAFFDIKKNNTLISFIFLILNIVSFFGIIYLVYFVSKALSSVARTAYNGQPISVVKTFLHFVFPPLGVFITQNKLNKIMLEDNAGIKNNG